MNKIINITKLISSSQLSYYGTSCIIKKYIKYKKKNHLLDFDDIIIKLYNKLNDSSDREWILYEINKQIEHLIIDEAQDNSDKQWWLVKKLTDDFLDQNNHKTLFIVGDIKQSIYSFQGAKPQLFLETKNYFKQKFEIYKKNFTYIEWNFSFRVPQNTLNFIDSYFNQHQLTQNLMLETINPLNHVGFNQNEGIIIDINYNKATKLKKISNLKEINKLTFFKTKTNSLNCSTWNNLLNTKTNNKDEVENKMFHVEQFEKNNIDTSNKYLNENVPRGTFSIEKKNIYFNNIIKNDDLYKNYNNRNVKLSDKIVLRGTISIRDKIKIQNCSTWNNLKKQTLENLVYSKILQEIQNGTKENEIMILFRSRNKTITNLVEILKRYKHKIYQKNNNIIKTSKTLKIIQLINIIIFQENIKTNSLNCSTWNNLLNTKINNKINTKMFHVEHFVNNKINNVNKSDIKLFHVEQFEKNNIYTSNKSLNENVPRGTISIRDKIKIQKCSTWNNFQKIQNNNLPNNKYYKQLNILSNKEINIEQLIYQLKLIRKDLPYSILLLKIQSALKKHLNGKIINKLITIIKNLEKQKIFSIKNFNLYLTNNSIGLEESSHKNGIKILTIHAAKGLESKTVILINNVLEKQFNSKNHKIIQSMNDQLLIENQKESSRLLYVALTRTKEKLILINE